MLNFNLNSLILHPFLCFVSLENVDCFRTDSTTCTTAQRQHNSPTSAPQRDISTTASSQYYISPSAPHPRVSSTVQSAHPSVSTTAQHQHHSLASSPQPQHSPLLALQPRVSTTALSQYYSPVSATANQKQQPPTAPHQHHITSASATQPERMGYMVHPHLVHNTSPHTPPEDPHLSPP